MIVYNLSMKVDPGIHNEWLTWQKDEFIPFIIVSGHFIDYKFFRLLDLDESDGFTYVLQFFSKDIDHYNDYINNHAAAHIQKAMKKWGNHLLLFGSAMEMVQ